MANGLTESNESDNENRLDDRFDARPTHDGVAMTYKGARFGFDGDYAVSTYRFACDCGFTCEITTREFSPRPTKDT